MVLGIASVERVLRPLADHARGGHVPTGLSEHAVVQQDAGDVLTASRGVHDLLQAFVHHVAVALEREHERVGLHALHAGGDRRRPAVQRLHEVDVHGPRERRVAADACDADRVLHLVEVGDRLEELPHRERLTAPGAHVVFLGEQQVGLVRLDPRARSRAQWTCRGSGRCRGLTCVVVMAAPDGRRARS